MSSQKVLKRYGREILGLHQQFLADGIGESSNASAYANMLGDTIKKMKTFDTRSPDLYVDYVARDMLRKKQSAEKRAHKKAIESGVDAPEATTTKKKEKPKKTSVNDEATMPAKKQTKKKKVSSDETAPPVTKPKTVTTVGETSKKRKQATVNNGDMAEDKPLDDVKKKKAKKA